jgi:hypothetical protein
MPDLLEQPERERVYSWRIRVLLDAGYPARLAEQLALREDVDLHRAVELAEQGCPYRTAAEILL